MTRPIINQDPEILGGTPVFMGTRVPVKALFDYLKAGDDLEDFLDDFPSVQRGQAVALLQRQAIDLFGTVEYEEDDDYKAQRKRK